ncbi:magnesium transporter [Catenibacillus scindens]|uniref:Magnesium transporter n=1 Tax=Catenibacillus scindens TaxID=673271 RepID=A0A7W8H9V1_9FIRM|nr:CorA family divalent cation transporter [Catenibacillus scindens]MBB5264403.1 magnesium transporter [Catenibacillus scindens]
MIFALGEQLHEITLEQAAEENIPAIYLTTSANCYEVLQKAGITYEGEINLDDAYFCKLETQQDCLYGTLAIPRLLDVLGDRYRMLLFVNRNSIVIVDDQGFSLRILERIRRKKLRQGETKAHFLYNFFGEFMSRDNTVLENFERSIMDMEDNILHEKNLTYQSYQNQMMPIRRQLLILRSYYEQLVEVGKAFEENENRFFAKKQLKYFGTLTDRADRLMGRTMHLIDYAKQVTDAYQSQVDAQQNNNMQFLTIISTIFLPLTLITSWYGMNFQNMPELTDGYPMIICLCVLVIIICIIIFKKKKML